MKAIVWTKYGSPDGLKLREVETPSPKDNEVLIRIHAATAATPDTEIRRLKLPILFAILFRLYLGLFKPVRKTILGSEFAGEVVSTGKGVIRYLAGDQVYGYTGLDMGTYAEYKCMLEDSSGFNGVLALKPENLSYKEAAAAPFGGTEALHAMQLANLNPGQKILIVGAGGTIGTYSVQFAKLYGAEVTGVDSAGKLEMLRSIGADHVIDYKTTDFTRNGEKYDVIMDTIGGTSFASTIRSLTDNGLYLNAKLGIFGSNRIRRAVKRAHKRILPWSAGYSSKNLLALKELLEAGKIKPVIDRCYPLEQAAEAHRYVDSGQKKGNVVLLID
jgi:NADPH:quinone reductase-like Zn-dependent oxidoreductase